MMGNKILVFGKGYIGERLREVFECDITEKMIYSLQDADKEVKKYQPNIIINCIGYTGKNNVDDCELEKDTTLTANTFVPIILAEVALRNNIKLVHISSGCIYDFDYTRQDPIKEEEIPLFFDLYYSRTKIYSERALDILSKKFNILILRIRIPLDVRPHPKNLLSKLIKYRNIIDIPNSVTYIPDFIEAMKHLITIDARGIYNVVNKNPLCYPELMDVYRKYNPDFSYRIIKLADLKLTRTNPILSTKKLENTGFKVRTIQEVLDECIRGYINYSLPALQVL